jgi:membrane protein implicated in regulation of membrane protease activity
MSAFIIWLIIGLVLIVAEIVTTTFILLFFGVGAIVTAVVAALGLESIAAQIILCTIVSGSGIFLFRGKLRSSLEAKNPMAGNDMHDEKLELSEDIPPGATAKIMFRGSPWTALNDSPDTMRKGQTVKIARTDGIKLILEKLY